MSYAEWEFQRAPQTLALFGPMFTPEEILGLELRSNAAQCNNTAKNCNAIDLPGAWNSPSSRVLDLGCGAGGKSVYYATLGAQVTGVDLVEDYRCKAEALAAEKGVRGLARPGQEADPGNTGSGDTGPGQNAGSGNSGPGQNAGSGSFTFVCADAANTGLPDAGFDTIIASDAMEHFPDPEGVLRECARLLRPGGRLFISFPPYGHPYGAHVSDLIGVPWAQLLFSDNDIAAAYSVLAADVPNGQKRVDLRFSRDPDGRWQNTYINRMTLRRFAKIKASITEEDGQTTRGDKGPKASSPAESRPSFRCLLYREIPLRRWLLPLARLPLTREYFVRMAVCVLERC